MKQQLNVIIDEMKEEIIKSTQELISIKSVKENPEEGKPFGEGIAKALDYCITLCDKLGFQVINKDNYVGFAEYGEGEEYVAVLGHLDVVPEGDGWIYPPYEAEIHEGKIYGRGAMDDKGPMISAIYGLKAIKEINPKLSKKVRIIFGTDEESGNEDMQYYLKYEKPPVMGFTPDAEYPVINGEKGITFFDLVRDIGKKSNELFIKYIKGGNKVNMVPDYCEAGIVINDINVIMNTLKEFVDRTGYKITAELKDEVFVMKSFGASAHGSTPELGKNAIMQLIDFLHKLPLGEDDITDFIKFMNKYVGMEVDGKSFGVGFEDQVSGKLSFNVGLINFQGDSLRVGLNLRYPVKCKYEELLSGINRRLEGTNIRIENMEHQSPLYYPEDNEIIKILSKVYEEETGDKSKVICIGGGTYAKEMPNIVAFGPIFKGEPDLDHQPNEYIKIEHLIKNTKIFANAIYELAK